MRCSYSPPPEATVQIAAPNVIEVDHDEIVGFMGSERSEPATHRRSLGQPSLKYPRAPADHQPDPGGPSCGARIRVL